uniref:Phosphodiesterase n=1 Tax=Euperipatoides kanangrensis TaxID=488523 RepID=A0A0F7VHM6_9BILA|nr:Eka-cGMP gated channel beta 2 protein [Euperipatoides kanangrensis]
MLNVSEREEYLRTEMWLDEHQDFVQDYFSRKATRNMIDQWLLCHALPQCGAGTQELMSPSSPGSKPSSGGNTPVRKISAHEFDRGGLLNPIVTTIDGTPTFLSQTTTTCAPSKLIPRKTKSELRSLDERELILELVKDICNLLEITSLCHKILQNVSILTYADRCSLFLVEYDRAMEDRYLVSKLFDVSCQSTLQDMELREEIRIPWNTGIVGYVAHVGEPVNIPDAYQDSRFNQEIDLKTGYKTRSILCMPIKDIDGEVIGVAQVINKISPEDEPFDENDEKVFASYLAFCGIGICNARLYERSQLENKRNQVLLDLARVIFEEQSTIENLVQRMMMYTQALLQCERCQVLLVDETSKGTFSQVFDFQVSDVEDNTSKKSPPGGRFPINIGITGYVAATGETLNIPDAQKDDRFDPLAFNWTACQVDRESGFHTRSILCMPMKNSSGQIIGVCQLINKLDGSAFNKNDENFFEAFAIFCGMGIHNTHMFEDTVKAMAKQTVALEVLSYHATAPLSDAMKLASISVQSAQTYCLYDFSFSDFALTDDSTLTACIRMFLELDYIEHFHINYQVLCRWLLSIKRNYRNVTYHNWRHAFNVAQTMFVIITKSQVGNWLSECECMALLVACLCHDLDHRGTNNTFQIKTSTPIAQLYSTSTMEHHHFDHCIMILNSKGNQILANLSTADYEQVIKTLEHAILATDLAVYFRKRGDFFNLIDNGNSDWSNDATKQLLEAMLMTACDVSAITKPWEIQKKVAELVAGEFFEQGDIEKNELKITPIDMMNREKKDLLPVMQVSFIDAICMPVYQAFAKFSSELIPLYEGVKSNRDNWQKLADEIQMQKLAEEQEGSESKSTGR